MGTKWNEIKAARFASAEAREGYEQAATAYEFGVRVRECREARGMSQAELATAIGSSQPAIARQEAGGTQPTLKTMRALSRALGASWVITPDGVSTATSPDVSARARPA